MSTSTASDFVVLRGGLSVPVEALQLLWALEGRRLTIRLDAAGGLLIGPREQLTEQDREGIRQHRDAILALVNYCEAIQ